jgi:hypothetical protein
MIRAWRERWGQGNFPFGIIQLPNYHAGKARSRFHRLELYSRGRAADVAKHRKYRA